MKPDSPTAIVVCGASGDLAKKKVIPALFSLYCQGYLPENFLCIGFARSEMDDLKFRNELMLHLTCRYTPDHSCEIKMQEFLSRCYYFRGQYDSGESFTSLYNRLNDISGVAIHNLMFYFAVPPDVYLPLSNAIDSSGITSSTRLQGEAWCRMVLEKPFGHDRESSDTLDEGLLKMFTEEQIFRIDHYLGKEVVQNLMVFRFANTIFEPIWNRDYIESVHIVWKEDIGIQSSLFLQ